MRYPQRRKSLRQRLLARCKQEDRGFDTPCFIWYGEKDKEGYGRIKRDGKYVQAHWVLKGDPPAGYEVDHLCHQRDCVRPSHLEHVSHSVNTQRRRSVGAQRRMTDEERSVARALLAEGKSVAEVSLVTGFSRRTIGRLNNE